MTMTRERAPLIALPSATPAQPAASIPTDWTYRTSTMLPIFQERSKNACVGEYQRK
jgi:hypothetical protein